MKSFGAGCIAVSSLALGLMALRERRQRICCLRALGAALALLASELEQCRTPLPRLASELAARTEYPASDFFHALAGGLTRLGELSFFEVWSTALADTLPELSAYERESLLEAGHYLGRFSANEQIRAVERSAALLSDALRREETAFRDGKKLCLALPAVAGALLVILLV